MTDDPNRIIVEPLTRGSLRTVYPLIQLADAAIGLPEWLRYARSAIAGSASRRGVLLARRLRQRHPCGAVCWHTERHARHGATLAAEHLVALDLVSPESVLAALVEALDGVAAALGCTAIRAIVCVRSDATGATLRSAGYRVEQMAFLRRIEPLPVDNQGAEGQARENVR